MRTIRVCPGIGDNIWLIQKLVNAGEQFHFELPDGRPQRGHQIFDILPSVAKSTKYVKMKTSAVEASSIDLVHRKWADVKEKQFYLSANKHLEAGKRIEDFFPDLQTSFRIDWDTDNYRNEAIHMLNDFAGADFVGLYGSSYNTSRSWGFWDEHKWLRLAEMVHGHNPNTVFIVIGADWDLDLGRNLMKLLNDAGLPAKQVIGYDLGIVIEIMKLLKYFFSFPSGLGILAPTVGCPVTMFYPDGRNGSPDLSKMMNAWADPADIESGRYKGCLFCEPEGIFNWAVENSKI